MLAEPPKPSPPFRPPCPECHGRGMTARKPVWLGGAVVGYRRDCCPCCGGTGRGEPQTPPPEPPPAIDLGGEG